MSNANELTPVQILVDHIAEMTQIAFKVNAHKIMAIMGSPEVLFADNIHRHLVILAALSF